MEGLFVSCSIASIISTDNLALLIPKAIFSHLDSSYRHIMCSYLLTIELNNRCITTLCPGLQAAEADVVGPILYKISDQ